MLITVLSSTFDIKKRVDNFFFNCQNFHSENAFLPKKNHYLIISFRFNS